MSLDINVAVSPGKFPPFHQQICLSLHPSTLSPMSKLDKFIDNTTDFLAAFPATTLSITYKNKGKSGKSNKITKPTNDSTTESVVSIKLYEPKLGKCVKYSTSKLKELNRILNFIGPKGIHMGDTHQVGLASIMSNTKFDDIVDVEPLEAKDTTPAPAPQQPKKKNKKKKKKN